MNETLKIIFLTTLVINILIKAVTPYSRKKTMNINLSIHAFEPHQCSRFYKMMSPSYLLPNDSRTEAQIIEEIRDFAEKFDDEWSYKWHRYNETYCHTFVFLLFASCNLADPDCIGAKKDPYFKSYKKS